ncbi:MAG TPA: molecular chaperone DnaJ [Ignavibacteria bacterium]|nr:molecular chaperone DnaJ [Ignavibacteria bacterium]HQY53293.1 molecular chaperone DnaJ [Ignavibacteria bacterium]HRB01287.1 molecular chaperone DnaJ [Ignavibacteria bacterium]
MTKRDYYEILSVSRTSTTDEIKTSYRKLAMKYHPDRNPNDNEAEEKFKELAEAYEILSNTGKRQRYDQFGHQGINGGGSQGFSDINDIFSQFGDIFGGRSGGSGGSIFDEFFGGGGGSSRRQNNNRGSDLKIALKLSLEEIADGVEKTVSLKKLKTCTTCNGTGAKGEKGYSNCTHCNGSGEVRHVSRSIFGQVVNVSMCTYCSGEGRIIKEKCSDCHGEGLKKEETKIKLDVPAGVQEGNYIPLRGQGNAGKRGGQNGDLLVFIEEEEHKYFVRDEDDIYYDLEISIVDAVVGADLVVPTLNGKVKLTVDPGTQSGSFLRMKGKGIKTLNGYGRGDEIIRINVHIPKKINSDEKKILNDLSRSENFKPRASKFKDDDNEDNNSKNSKSSDKKSKKQDKGFFKTVFS